MDRSSTAHEAEHYDKHENNDPMITCARFALTFCLAVLKAGAVQILIPKIVSPNIMLTERKHK